MDVITISSSDEEDEDPLRLIIDNVTTDNKNGIRITKRPTNEEIIGNDTHPQELKSTSARRIQLVPVKNGVSDGCLSHTDINSDSAVNGCGGITQPHKTKTVIASPLTTSDSTTKAEDTSSVEQNMETNQSESLFTKFTDLCKEVGDQGPEMDKIVTKAWNYYSLTKVEFKTSRECLRLIEKNIERVKKDPSSMYSYMLEVIKELKSRKRKATTCDGEPEAKQARVSNGPSDAPSTSQEVTEDHNNQDTHKDDSGSDSDTEDEQVQKRRLQIKRLSKRLKGISKQIQKIETAEVDWDDDGDSTYIALQMWKDRAVKIYKKLCELTGERDKSSYKIQLHNLDSTSRFPEVDRCIRKFVNSTGQFPDFQDILKIYREYNEENQLNLTPTQLHTCAADMFQYIGNELQRKRKLDNWDLHCDFLRDEPDPADEDNNLMECLQENRKKFISNVNQIVDEFAQKQKEQKLEPVEVTEEDANKSEGDNTDPEEDENTQLGLDDIPKNKKESLSGSESDDNTNDSTVDSKVSDNITDTERTEVNVLTSVNLTATEPPTRAVVPTEEASHEKTPVANNVSEENAEDGSSVKLDIAVGAGDNKSLTAVAEASSDLSSAEPAKKDVDFQVS